MPKVIDMSSSFDGTLVDAFSYTVEPVLTHTPRWTVRAMGYYRSWVSTGMLIIDSKNHEKISKIKQNIRTIDLHYIHC